VDDAALVSTVGILNTLFHHIARIFVPAEDLKIVYDMRHDASFALGILVGNNILYHVVAILIWDHRLDTVRQLREDE
jgi:hypothetical protein